MSELFFDTETFSCCDLKAHGTPRYAADPSTEIMIAQWALDDADTVVEDLTQRAGMRPSEFLLDELNDPNNSIVIHNSMFDRSLVRHVWGIDLRTDRIDDTMIKAYAHALPGALGKVGEVLGLPLDQQKDKRGARLIQLFCKPAPLGNKIRRATRFTHPAEWAEFLEYSRDDIVSMRAAHRKLPNWNYRIGHAEHALWELDQRINDRGFAVDVELATAAIEVSQRKQKNLAEEVSLATAGEVEKATKRDALLKHILEWYGVTLPDMKKDTLKRRMEDPELPSAVRQLLAIRLEASMTSTGKYAALLKAVSADGRLRNTLQFAGAQRTERWAGRIFQPQNMMRPTMKADQIAMGIELIKARCPEILFPNVMTLTGNAVRGCIVAPPGKKLCIADLANIEGRGLVSLSGELWKLQAFRDYDTIIGRDAEGKAIRKGHDMYVMAYARAFGIDPRDVTDEQRQIGKVMELGLGYGGGVAAFITFAAVYNMDLDDLAEAVWASAAPEVITDAMGVWNWAQKKRRSTFGLSMRVYVACEILKRLWRDAHPCTEALWAQCNEAYKQATANPGVVFDAGPLKFRRDGAWLRVRLPSGRYLCYLHPKVEGGQCTYMGVNIYTRQWGRIKTYGGKIVENATQAWARDVLAHNMPRVEAAGYEIVLTVHDELLTETPDTDVYSSDELARLMAVNPPWAPDTPLAAAGFEAYRYRKG